MWMYKLPIEKWKGDVIKEKFFDTTKYKNNYNTIFNHAVALEKKNKKDLAEFDKELITLFLQSFKSGNDKTLNGYKSLSKKYAEYYKKETDKSFDISVWDEVNLQYIKNHCVIKENQVDFISREKIEEVLGILANPCDQFLILGLYEGLYGDYLEDIWKLEGKDLKYSKCKESLPSGKTNIVSECKMSLPSGRIISVSERLMKIARLSKSIDYYESLSGMGVRESLFSEDCSERIFKYHVNAVKEKVDEPSTAKIRVTARLVAIRNATGLSWLTIPKLNTSGLIQDTKDLIKNSYYTKDTVFNSNEFNKLRYKHHNSGLMYQLIPFIKQHL